MIRSRSMPPLGPRSQTNVRNERQDPHAFHPIQPSHPFTQAGAIKLVPSGMKESRMNLEDLYIPYALEPTGDIFGGLKEYENQRTIPLEQTPYLLDNPNVSDGERGSWLAFIISNTVTMMTPPPVKAFLRTCRPTCPWRFQISPKPDKEALIIGSTVDDLFSFRVRWTGI